VKTGKFTSMIAAAALAIAPVAATAASPVQDPGARASAELSDASAVDEGTTVFLGILLLVLFAIVVISNNGDDVNNTPASP
jgi:hypothetical protein